VSKYACLFIEEWTCPIFKRFNTTDEALYNTEVKEFEVFAKFCAVCPHIKKK
jgi:hypothetical protein